MTKLNLFQGSKAGSMLGILLRELLIDQKENHDLSFLPKNAYNKINI